MDKIPLHPAFVHMPLALAVVAPFVVAACLLACRAAPRVARRWWPAPIVLLLVAVSAFAAAQTGESEEDRIESFVSERAIHLHEERAEMLVRLAAGAALISLFVPFAGRRSIGRLLGVATLVASLAVAGLAIGTGHSGAALIWVHGAAQSRPDEAARVTTSVRPADARDERRSASD